MSPKLFILIDQNPFHLNIAPTTLTPAHPNKFNPDGALVPYMQEEISTIDAKFATVKNYFKTWKNIYQAFYDTLNMHANNEFKVAPPTSPPTKGWNSTMLMSLCNIFNQLATTYGKPTPDTMRQKNLSFLVPYNLQEPSELLFKQCTVCQDITTLAKKTYTTEQLLLNALDLIA
jgi:hypothetical protein